MQDRYGPGESLSIADQDLIARRVDQMRFRRCAAPAQHRHQGLRFPDTDKRFVATLRRQHDSHPLDHPPHLDFNNGNAALPPAEARPRLEAGTLREILSDWTLTSMPMAIFYLQTHQLSARVQVFVQWVAGLFEGDGLWSDGGQH
ncbi:LysR substrate-binding domain protein [Bordetella bronchiseptica GA96-01]|uniref:hypothetical protein n=1 Tax=Bordetella bronchiseptica TaxID=518 RepID=UPI00049F77F1|nr:hypothetical protein [Bordetella bronchiseptica]KDC40209.1 LysR substrate-binding domain protein [Bordetella bronchiseptica GA96-01]